jgi:hypothetical protein
LGGKKRPVGKKYVSSWRIIFSQLETLFLGVIGFLYHFLPFSPFKTSETQQKYK